MAKHDDDLANGFATQRTRISTSMVFSMPAHVNAEAVKDSVRSLAEDEFGGRHDYVMALHTDTKHPHVHLTVRTVGEDGIKLNLRKADLQYLRDQFASKLRQRGIDAEATPRHARGVPQKSPQMAMYKIRQRGQVPATDRAKREEVERDMAAHGGRLPDYPWDHAMMNRRNRVMGTYIRAATALARSEDAEDQALARDTERFVASLTSSRTERVQMASEASQGRSGGRSGVQGGERASERGRGPREDEKGRPDRER
ncbi:relaxase/mobilization nuclease domain-containing protein [Roseobacter weihaiensis]|uniref:relaxase/mobilization nuclease domain-containing protein n=1 Tax=Roseobacter weihaiensis TaxID=2763262 RepID=UPI001D0A9DFA|nr:relaxase/mobilization nuclease domain-containing protein [Roseobacter sp. H9]